MASTRRFAVGLLVLAAVTLSAAAWLFDHHHPTLAAIGGVVGGAVGVVGILSLIDRGFDLSPDAQNRVLGVLTVFGSVGAFGLIVAAVMLLIE